MQQQDFLWKGRYLIKKIRKTMKVNKHMTGDEKKKVKKQASQDEGQEIKQCLRQVAKAIDKASGKTKGQVSTKERVQLCGRAEATG